MCNEEDTIEHVLLHCTGPSEERPCLQKLVKEQGIGELLLAIIKKKSINPLLWNLAHRVYKRHWGIDNSGLETRWPRRRKDNHFIDYWIVGLVPHKYTLKTYMLHVSHGA